MQWRYSAVQNVGLLVSVLPVIAAAQLVDTLDWYPYLLCAALGLALAFGLRGAAASLRRRSAAFVAGEVAAEQAPGGFVLWLAPPLWCIALGLFVNAYLDPSSPTEHASQLLRVRHPHKGPSKYVFRGFRPGEAELEVRAGAVGGPLTEDGEVTIVAREGLFGWTRIAAIHPR